MTMFGRHTIDPRTVHDEREAYTLVDVREADEWRAGHVAGATHVPLSLLPLRLDEIDRSRPVAVICRSGSRSGAATRFLRQQGVDALNVHGGVATWARLGLPLTTPSGAPGRVA